VRRIVEGLRALRADDRTALEHGIVVFDALARSFESDDPIERSAGRTGRTTRQAGRRRPT
jgi:hypothetical protein